LAAPATDFWYSPRRIIDLPAPGCWTLHLSWSGHTDELKLRYVA
jgi:hypothetical protein